MQHLVQNIVQYMVQCSIWSVSVVIPVVILIDCRDLATAKSRNSSNQGDELCFWWLLNFLSYTVKEVTDILSSSINLCCSNSSSCLYPCIQPRSSFWKSLNFNIEFVLRQNAVFLFQVSCSSLAIIINNIIMAKERSLIMTVLLSTSLDTWSIQFLVFLNSASSLWNLIDLNGLNDHIDLSFPQINWMPLWLKLKRKTVIENPNNCLSISQRIIPIVWDTQCLDVSKWKLKQFIIQRWKLDCLEILFFHLHLKQRFFLWK